MSWQVENNELRSKGIAMSMNAASSGNTETFDVVVIGGGAAGIGVTASLLRRRLDLRIAITEPGDRHFYQPAWTLVGGGAFNIDDTVRPMSSVWRNLVTAASCCRPSRLIRPCRAPSPGI
jgi:ribulose 1,5-bisphosphate synthetase/thiazole synthase